MQIFHTPAEMHTACRNLSGNPRTLGLVATMGALHAGHLSLVAAARTECDLVAASIFVNPTQFAPGEDYDAYPRTFDDDCRQLEASGVDLLFSPSAADMYPASNTTFIDPGPIAIRLDGASRPGHFRGVATIVARLFHIVAPDRAYFGQKDAAQIAVIRHIVRDLNIPVHIAVCPIIREPDGLAMSSRNRYLSAEERTRARILYRALNAAVQLTAYSSQADSSRTIPTHTAIESLRSAMLEVFAADPSVHLEYAAVVNPDTLLPVEDLSRSTLLAVAAWVGHTRLIDNHVLIPASTP